MTTISIIDAINGMNTSELISLNNIYCSTDANYNDYDFIYENDEYFFQNYIPESYDAVKKILNGKYSLTHRYVKFDINDNLVSFDNINSSDLCCNIEKIAEYIFNNKSEFDTFNL